MLAARRVLSVRASARPRSRSRRRIAPERHSSFSTGGLHANPAVGASVHAGSCQENSEERDGRTARAYSTRHRGSRRGKCVAGAVAGVASRREKCVAGGRRRVSRRGDATMRRPHGVMMRDAPWRVQTMSGAIMPSPAPSRVTESPGVMRGASWRVRVERRNKASPARSRVRPASEVRAAARRRGCGVVAQ